MLRRAARDDQIQRAVLAISGVSRWSAALSIDPLIQKETDHMPIRESNVLNRNAALVTGASSGIGAAVARMLAEEGAAVALAARREDRLEALKEDIESGGGQALVVETDVTSREQVQRLVDQTKDAFGSIDVLINNAGLMPLSFMKNLHEEEWERMVDVNVKGVLYAVGAALPHMTEQESGHVVNISSTAGRRVYPGSAVYSGTKHFVRAFSEGLRSELSSVGIRVTTIAPGATETELAETITDDELEAFMGDAFDGYRLMDADDVAEAIRYALTSPAHVDVEELMVTPTGQSR